MTYIITLSLGSSDYSDEIINVSFEQNYCFFKLVMD